MDGSTHDAIRSLESKPYYQIVGETDGRPDIAKSRHRDYSIPELNGLDLSHALKRELPRIEILLYTMHDREEIIIEVLGPACGVSC
jgi:DNA-binding NarL/FixJ family response regulator